ncbi:MAG: transcription antitermination factor NusB [Deltaproteobacteria bacterium HGW-Deltaproteobacteria-19]|jgi:N utilization substance protein B|nr:MAG: transcription antitermination factor NusB [Deltaproteobacteria bacterium HGW-Deltaproteobacteria-19]
MQVRRKAREAAVQILYGLDVQERDPWEALEHYWQNFDRSEMPAEAREFAAELVTGTWERRDEIDGLIGSCSEHWSLPRMSKVDKAILRMAVYELRFCPGIPPKVALNEAIDLGKLFGSENSGAFINGILDALHGRFARENRPPEPQPGAPASGESESKGSASDPD